MKKIPTISSAPTKLKSSINIPNTTISDGTSPNDKTFNISNSKNFSKAKNASRGKQRIQEDHFTKISAREKGRFSGCFPKKF